MTQEATFAERLQGATRLHQSGRIVEAESIYRGILEAEPDCFEAIQLLGVANLALGDPARALEMLERAERLNPDFAPVRSNLGLALHELGRFEAALEAFDAAIQLKPDYAEAHFNRGVTMAELGRFEDAVGAYDAALALSPDLVAAHSNRGLALAKLGRVDQAIESHDRAVGIAPASAAAQTNRGQALQAAGRLAEATECYERALAADPGFAKAHCDLGNALHAQGRPGEALACYERAAALDPQLAEAWSNRAVALQELKRWDEALASADAAIALKPSYSDAHCNRGIALRALHRLPEAAASFDEAVSLRPTSAHARWNRSLLRLTCGDYEGGWRDHEWRKNFDGATGARGFAEPLWLGDGDITGKRVFLYWEQGLGDTLQFCRFARLVSAGGGRPVLSVQEPLVRLLRQLEPEVEIIGAAERPARFDYHCPLMSLPLSLGVTLEALPMQEPLLQPRADDRAVWAARLGTRGKPRVGLVWAGNPVQKDDRNRSVALAALRPLIASRSVQWISLQKELREGDADVLAQHGHVRRMGEHVGDFADIAALIEQLDLVITVDTAVAHLAGAMAKPVWVMLPFAGDWRWLLDREDSPWYPSARLFRQTAPADWASVVARVTSALGDRFQAPAV